MASKIRGRPRSESTRASILAATRDLIVEIGYEAMSIEAIASRAGAGKQSIYRRWSTKSAVVVDAIVGGVLVLPKIDIPNTGTLKEDLEHWMIEIGDAVADQTAGSVVRAMVTAASNDSADGARLYEHVTAPLYRALTGRLAQAQRDGDFASSVDPVTVADALIGTILFRTLAQLPLNGTVSALIDLLPRP